ncbi:hypothetical protein [Sunxiuqinia indica]|uniref:hypothetical protein n=1 Tax=Sunxiuqinia indica TaxID=2692584 RepID=UPI0013570C2C|nr:hypothetical protein [Sunxiuqinia indica]
MNMLTKTLIGVIIALSLAFSAQSYLYKKSRETAKRETANVKSLLKDKDLELKLTRKEYKESNLEAKQKIDSIRKEYNIKLKEVKSATVVKTVYIDTTTQTAEMGLPEEIIQPKDTISPIIIQNIKPLYRIPTNIKGSCWSMKGEIISHDPESRLNVIERRSDNSIQLLVTRERFLGFLWWKGKQEFKAYSDCGEKKVTKIEFTK